MSEFRPVKKVLLGSSALIGAGLLIPTTAMAAPCPANITGSALAGTICDFNAGSSVTVQNGGTIGGIVMQGYSPGSSFILNNGTITNSTDPGMYINSSALTSGLSNTGLISTSANSIEITNNSTISGGISNSGNITSSDGEGLRIFSGNTISGGISNSGIITSNSTNDVAVLIRGNNIVSGGITNDGTIRATGIGTGLRFDSSSSLVGGITNSGTISGGQHGLSISNVSTISGNITNSGTLSGASDDGLNISNGSTINGNVSNLAGGTITGGDAGIQINSATTITGSVSNAGTITGTNTGIYVGSTSNITGGITNSGTIQGGINAIFIDAPSNVSGINLLAGSRVIGSINAVNTDVNILGDFNSEGTMSVNNLNISSGATFNMANAITAQNTVTNAGTLEVGTAARTITGNYTQATGGVLKVGVQNTGAYGHIAVSNAVDLSQSGAINVDVVSGANIAVGNVFTNIISGSALVAPAGGFSVTDNSWLFNYSAAVNGGSGVNLTTALGNSVEESNVATGNNGGMGAARKLDEIIAAGTGGDWQNVVNAFATLSNAQQVTDATNQTLPALAGATNVSLIENMSTASRIVQARQESSSRASAGESFETSRNFWLKPFGTWGRQGNHDGVVGYDSNAYGLIVGSDKAVTDKARLGVGVSYFNSNLSSNGNYNKVDVDSYLGIVYGSYKIDDRTDVNGQIEAGYNRSESDRYINFGGLSRIAKGSYDGWNFHAGTGVGHSLNFGNDTTITPQVRVDYFVVGNEAYDESGAGVLNLHVDSQTEDQLIPAVEVKASHTFTPQLSFALNAGVGYDLLNDGNSVAASFAGGGGVFTTHGLEPSPWVVRSGAGVTWKQSDALDLTARYDRKDRGSEYDDQTVSLKLRMLF